MYEKTINDPIMRVLGLLVALAGTLALVGAAVPAHAQSNGIFKVLVGTDAPDANLADNICDADPGAAQACTLRAAIMQSNAMPGPNIIDVQSGTNRLTIQGAGEDAGRTGDLDITDEVLISIGQNDTPFTIDATGLSDRALDLRSLNGQPVKVQLITMVVKGGQAHRHGGSMRVGAFVDALVWLSRIEGATAGEAGGAIYNSGMLRVRDSVIERSRTLQPSFTSGGGGGIFSERSLTLTDTLVRNNTSAGRGGGIAAEQTIAVERSSIINNNAGNDGGGLFTANVDLALLNTTISGNRANIDVAQHIFSRGGGVAIMRTVGSVRIYNTTIAGNSAFAGGGVHAEQAGMVGRTAGHVFDQFPALGREAHAAAVRAAVQQLEHRFARQRRGGNAGDVAGQRGVLPNHVGKGAVPAHQHEANR